jgi:tRNA(Ile)-lysidine synthase
MQLLLDLQSRWDWHLAIGHCDHGWRPDSTANADYVESLAQGWQVPCFRQTVCRQTDPDSHSEAAARQWRYQSLATLAEQQAYSAILTAHTASDRAETLLYNLLRGSGADGLQALTWHRRLTATVSLVRPLLNFTRSETGQFCQDRALPIWPDATNADLKHPRNRLRQEVIPYLKTHFNPRVEQHLAQTAELLQAEVAYLESLAAELLSQARVIQSDQSSSQPAVSLSGEESSDQWVGLQCPILRSVPLALQRRVIRQFLQQQLPSMPGFEEVEKLVGLITAPNRSQTDPLPGGAIAWVQDDQIWLSARPPN